jgi:hypothetical protein
VIVSLQALGRAMRVTPLAPTSVAALLANHEAELTFRRIVREIFPEDGDEILAARHAGEHREHVRVWALLQRVEAEYFPVYELDEYDQVACGIPFVRNGWSYDRFHELEMRPGELLLFGLCAQPFAPGFDSRVPLVDACEAHVPQALLGEIPEGGFSPTELHGRLDGTRFAAAAEFADWLWAETGSVFLDLDEEIEVTDAEWTRENVMELAEQWQRAEGIFDRITDLAAWLEAELPLHFSQLLDAVLGRDAHVIHERMRRQYGYEITEAGLVPIDHESDTVALPLDAAGPGGDRGGSTPPSPGLPWGECGAARL